MNYAYIAIGLSEVPDEISLCIGITGCSVHCPGCHSKELWDASNGDALTEDVYKYALQKYRNKCSCICFMGGEWHPEVLTQYLQMAREAGYKTCLYTGENWVAYEIMEQLDYVKTGAYIPHLGGLCDRSTNQRMYKIEDGAIIDITSQFWR